MEKQIAILTQFQLQKTRAKKQGENA
nr:hypothetical protein [Sicyoidochytrium minutum DNA virus]